MALWFPKRDNDYTTQGKLAYGCLCMIWLAIAALILIGFVQITVCYLTGYCEGYSY